MSKSIFSDGEAKGSHRAASTGAQQRAALCQYLDNILKDSHSLRSVVLWFLAYATIRQKKYRNYLI